MLEQPSPPFPACNSIITRSTNMAASTGLATSSRLGIYVAGVPSGQWAIITVRCPRQLSVLLQLSFVLPVGSSRFGRDARSSDAFRLNRRPCTSARQGHGNSACLAVGGEPNVGNSVLQGAAVTRSTDHFYHSVESRDTVMSRRKTNKTALNRRSSASGLSK